VNVVYVLTTGGTIEKVYSEQTGAVGNFDGKINRYLSLLRLPDCDVRVVPLMNKDSREMTDADRVLILSMVRGPAGEHSHRNYSRHGHDGRDWFCIYRPPWLASLFRL
jgi:L-asparaginase/Glu-tRNA(Gln) amidotransferase subunit D